ncbi:MAG: type II toxin-antitoxin system VapC family toxin [Burkholderiales bacterium]
MSAQGAAAAATVLSWLDPVVHELRLSVSELRALALRHGLSAYDASYLALALELRFPVAFGDRPVRAALPGAGVKLA